MTPVGSSVSHGIRASKPTGDGWKKRRWHILTEASAWHLHIPDPHSRRSGGPASTRGRGCPKRREPLPPRARGRDRTGRVRVSDRSIDMAAFDSTSALTSASKRALSAPPSFGSLEERREPDRAPSTVRKRSRHRPGRPLGPTSPRIAPYRLFRAALTSPGIESSRWADCDWLSRNRTPSSACHGSRAWRSSETVGWVTSSTSPSGSPRRLRESTQINPRSPRSGTRRRQLWRG